MGAKVSVVGELTTAKDFSEDNLYVTLETRLPEGWHWNLEDYEDPRATETDESDLINRGRAITQLARAVPYGEERKPVAHFSFPLSWSFLASPQGLQTAWPQVLIQVNSCDSWHRYRIEGYGFLQLPTQAGFHQLSVRTYRPLENLYAEVYSFFLGGSVKVENPWDMAQTFTLDEEGQKTNVNRFGLATVSSGKVLFNLSVAIQEHGLMEQARKQAKALNHKQKTELAWRSQEKKAHFVLGQTLGASRFPPAAESQQFR